jgi:SNF2 family DNA or RNA helicase
LRNRHPALYDKLNYFETASRLLITGDSLENNVKELGILVYSLKPWKIGIDYELDL